MDALYASRARGSDKKKAEETVGAAERSLLNGSSFSHESGLANADGARELAEGRENSRENQVKR